VADLEMQLLNLLQAMVDRQGGPLELKRRLAAMEDPRVADWGYNFKIDDIVLKRDPVTTETGPGVAIHRIRIDLVANYGSSSSTPQVESKSFQNERKRIRGLLGGGS
jgi:hypothetical protein